jgi:hypothetical protein
MRENLQVSRQQGCRHRSEAVRNLTWLATPAHKFPDMQGVRVGCNSGEKEVSLNAILIHIVTRY